MTPVEPLSPGSWIQLSEVWALDRRENQLHPVQQLRSAERQVEVRPRIEDNLAAIWIED